MSGATLTRPGALPRAAASARSAGAWVALATVLAGGLNYAYTLVLTALLPAQDYAVFASGQALLLVAGSVANAALPWVLAQELARGGGDGRARAEAVWFAVVLNALLGAGAGVLVMGAASGFAHGAVLGVLGASSLGFFAASTAVGWAQGMGRFRLLAGFLVAEVGVKVAVGLALVQLGAGVAGALTGALLGTAGVAAVGAWLMRADLAPSRAAVRVLRLWRGSLGMIGVQGLVTVAAAIDVVLVVVLFEPGPDVAAYQVAATLGRVPLFLATALAMVAFGTLSRRPGDRAAISENASALLCLALPLTLVAASAPPQLVALVLPDAYGQVSAYLPVTAATGAVLAFVTLQAGWFRAAGRFGPCVSVLAGGAVGTAACVVAGASLGELGGMGVGALVGASATSAALWGLGERLWPGAQRPALGRPLALTLAAAPLVVLAEASPAAWVLLAAVVLAGAAWSAFGPAPTPRTTGGLS